MIVGIACFGMLAGLAFIYAVHSANQKWLYDQYLEKSLKRGNDEE